MEPDDSALSRNFSKKASPPRVITSCCAIRYSPPRHLQGCLNIHPPYRRAWLLKIYLVFYVVNMYFDDLLICKSVYF